jgi:hypothetical protein
MNRTRPNDFDDDENFETVTGLDGKPVRILKDKGRVRISMAMRDAVVGINGVGSHGARGEVEGDLCTRNGWPGILARGADGELFCDIGRKDALPQFTDGYNFVDPAAGMKPGWRMPVVQDRRAVHDAYAASDAYQRNRYKCSDGDTLCDDCDGDGVDQDGNVCDTCCGTGIMPDSNGNGNGGDPDPTSDSRSVKDQAYSTYDAELSNAWRKG